jgi:hypothetical protein
MATDCREPKRAVEVSNAGRERVSDHRLRGVVAQGEKLIAERRAADSNARGKRSPQVRFDRHRDLDTPIDRSSTWMLNSAYPLFAGAASAR